VFKGIEDVINKYNGECNLLNYANGLIIKKNSGYNNGLQKYG